MNHAEVLNQSASTIIDLTKKYGTRELVFHRASQLASLLLNRTVTPYEVTMITSALNLAHLQENRADSHNYVSAIANMAFSAQFAAVDVNTDKLAPEKDLFQGIENIVKNFSVPNPMPNSTPSNVTMKGEPEA
jgi:hypothetical protein